MNVVINFHKNQQAADETAAIVTKNGGQAVTIAQDISDEAAADALVKKKLCRRLVG